VRMARNEIRSPKTPGVCEGGGECTWWPSPICQIKLGRGGNCIRKKPTRGGRGGKGHFEKKPRGVLGKKKKTITSPKP